MKVSRPACAQPPTARDLVAVTGVCDIAGTRRRGLSTRWAGDKRNAVAPRLWGRVSTDPFRLRVPFAPDDGDSVRYGAAEVEWRPISARDVWLIELPQPGPGPLLATLVTVTVQVEDASGGRSRCLATGPSRSWHWPGDIRARVPGRAIDLPLTRRPAGPRPISPPASGSFPI